MKYIFQQNNISCLDIVRKTSEELELRESLTYPNLRKDRIQKEKDTLHENVKKEYGLIAETNPVALYNNNRIYLS